MVVAKCSRQQTDEFYVVIYLEKLLAFLNADNERSNIVTGGVVVLRMRPIAKWEGPGEPASAVDFLAFLDFIHSSNWEGAKHVRLTVRSGNIWAYCHKRAYLWDCPNRSGKGRKQK